MKLIVDIPEDYKEGKYSPIWFEKVIKNGTPVTNEDDLISRKALKEAINSLYEYDTYNEEFDAGVQSIINFIDNAPTVEPEVYMNGKDYNLYLEGYKQGKKDFERPQGEWINERYDGLWYHTCSECKAEIEFDRTVKRLGRENFCRNCGAEMKGGAE